MVQLEAENIKGVFPNTNVAEVVYDAMNLDFSLLPEDLLYAATNFVRWSVGVDDAERPEWVRTYEVPAWAKEEVSGS